MKIELELNFRLDEVNHNGRIYPKEVFKETMDKAIKEGLKVYVYNYNRSFLDNYRDEFSQTEAERLESNKVLGDVLDYRIEDDGDVFFTVDCEQGSFLEKTEKVTAVFTVKSEVIERRSNVMEEVDGILGLFPVGDRPGMIDFLDESNDD